MFNIKTMNTISPAGIDALEKKGCTVGEDLENPDGLLIRSAKLHGVELPESVLAIARAGAGYNNIPVKDYYSLFGAVFNGDVIISGSRSCNCKDSFRKLHTMELCTSY